MGQDRIEVSRLTFYVVFIIEKANGIKQSYASLDKYPDVRAVVDIRAINYSKLVLLCHGSFGKLHHSRKNLVLVMGTTYLCLSIVISTRI